MDNSKFKVKAAKDISKNLEADSGYEASLAFQDVLVDDMKRDASRITSEVGLSMEKIEEVIDAVLALAIDQPDQPQYEFEKAIENRIDKLFEPTLMAVKRQLEEAKQDKEIRCKAISSMRLAIKKEAADIDDIVNQFNCLGENIVKMSDAKQRKQADEWTKDFKLGEREKEVEGLTELVRQLQRDQQAKDERLEAVRLELEQEKQRSTLLDYQMPRKNFDLRMLKESLCASTSRSSLSKPARFTTSTPRSANSLPSSSFDHEEEDYGGDGAPSTSAVTPATSVGPPPTSVVTHSNKSFGGSPEKSSDVSSIFQSEKTGGDDENKWADESLDVFSGADDTKDGCETKSDVFRFTSDEDDPVLNKSDWSSSEDDDSVVEDTEYTEDSFDRSYGSGNHRGRPSTRGAVPPSTRGTKGQPFTIWSGEAASPSTRGTRGRPSTRGSGGAVPPSTRGTSGQPSTRWSWEAAPPSTRGRWGRPSTRGSKGAVPPSTRGTRGLPSTRWSGEAAPPLIMGKRGRPSTRGLRAAGPPSTRGKRGLASTRGFRGTVSPVPRNLKQTASPFTWGTVFSQGFKLATSSIEVKATRGGKGVNSGVDTTSTNVKKVAYTFLTRSKRALTGRARKIKPPTTVELKKTPFIVRREGGARERSQHSDFRLNNGVSLSQVAVPGLVTPVSARRRSVVNLTGGGGDLTSGLDSSRGMRGSSETLGRRRGLPAIHSSGDTFVRENSMIFPAFSSESESE